MMGPKGRSQPSLAVKAVIALSVCLFVRMLAAQAPAVSLPREDTDAEGYKVQIPTEALTKGPNARTQETKFRNQVRDILNGSAGLTAETRSSFRGYFTHYLFPLMTTEEGQKTIGNERQNLLRSLQAAKSKEAHDELTNITLQAMQRIAQDPAYRLTTRYNAMLIVGSLNDQEGSTAAPPVPMRAATGFLLQQFRRPDNHDSIKIAALIGLARHLECDNFVQAPFTPIAAAGKDAIIKDLTTLAEEKQPPEGRLPEVHNWMRRRAIEGLAFASLTKPNPAIAGTIEKLIKDEADTVPVRLAAASALGRMSLQPPVQLDAVATAKELGYLALVACDAELTKAETYRKTEAEREARLMGTYSSEIDYAGPGGAQGSGMGYGMPGGEGGGLGGVRPIRPTPGVGGMESEYGGLAGPGGIDPSMMDPKHYRVDYLRRRIRQHLHAVQVGLAGNEDFVPPRTKTGPAKSAPTPKGQADAVPADKRGVHAIAKPDQQEAVKDVYYKVRRLAEVIEVSGASVDFFQLVKDLRQELRPLEAITKRLQPAAAAVAGNEDAPSVPTAKAPGKAGGKPTPVKAGPPPGAKGKSAIRVPPRQPNVIAKPNR